MPKIKIIAEATKTPQSGLSITRFLSKKTASQKTKIRATPPYLGILPKCTSLGRLGHLKNLIAAQ